MKVTQISRVRPVTASTDLGGGGGGISGGNDAGLPPASGTIPTASGSNTWAWGSNVAVITSNSSNVLLGPFVNFASGANVAFAAASNTLTISSTASGGGGGGSFTFLGARVTKATQTISNTTLTKLSFDTEAYDSSAFHDNGTNPERLTIPATGKYRVSAGFLFNFTTSNELDLLIQLGGTSGLANAIAGMTTVTATGKWTSVSFDRDFTSGNFLEVEVFHDNGSARAVTLAYFTIQRLDPA